MTRVHTFTVVLFAAVMCACSRSAPQPPTVTPAPGGETITGTERIGWDQRAGDAAELGTFRYAIYVDGARSELAGVSCATTATNIGYPCTARLPTITAGNHTLEIAAFTQDGSILESPRSAALHVTVIGATAINAGDELPNERPRATERPAETQTDWPPNARPIAAGFEQPADLAVLPDGRLLVAEQRGRIRIVDDGQLIPVPAATLDRASPADVIVAIAADPQFDRTHFVYVLSTERSREGTQRFVVSRWRETANTLADRIVLLDSVDASPEPHGALRFGPDGKLYVAFDDGGRERNAEDPASFNGKLLRLNPDGTTPVGQPGNTPIAGGGYHSPRGLAWHGATGHMWDADATRVGAMRWDPAPLAMIVSGDDLYVASESGLWRIRTGERHMPLRSTTQNVFRATPVRALAATSDRIYFATTNALGLLER